MGEEKYELSTTAWVLGSDDLEGRLAEAGSKEALDVG